MQCLMGKIEGGGLMVSKRFLIFSICCSMPAGANHGHRDSCPRFLCILSYLSLLFHRSLLKKSVAVAACYSLSKSTFSSFLNPCWHGWSKCFLRNRVTGRVCIKAGGWSQGIPRESHASGGYRGGRRETSRSETFWSISHT